MAIIVSPTPRNSGIISGSTAESKSLLAELNKLQLVEERLFLRFLQKQQELPSYAYASTGQWQSLCHRLQGIH